MYSKFIKFLEDSELYNEEVFDHMNERARLVKYNETSKDFFGCYPIVDENNILRDIRICIPHITDHITAAINIHEYVHYLFLYRNLNKKYIEDEYAELMPVFYELAYLKEQKEDKYYNYYLDHIQEKDNYLKTLLKIYKKEDNKEYQKK